MVLRNVEVDHEVILVQHLRSNLTVDDLAEQTLNQVTPPVVAKRGRLAGRRDGETLRPPPPGSRHSVPISLSLIVGCRWHRPCHRPKERSVVPEVSENGSYAQSSKSPAIVMVDPHERKPEAPCGLHVPGSISDVDDRPVIRGGALHRGAQNRNTIRLAVAGEEGAIPDFDERPGELQARRRLPAASREGH